MCDEQELELADRLGAARLAGLEVEIGELLVARDVVGRELARDLIRLGRRLGVTHLIGADVAELASTARAAVLVRRVVADAA